MKYKELKKAVKKADKVLAYTLLFGTPEEVTDGAYLQITKKHLLLVINEANKEYKTCDFNADLRDNYLYIN